MFKLTLVGLNSPTLVDDFHADLGRYRWRVDKDGYVFRHADGRVMLHHVVLPRQPAPGMVRDHINRDKLDNRRANLRWVTYSQSNANRGVARRNGTGFRGVRFDQGKQQFLATVQMGGKAVVRRWFDDPLAANDFLIGERRRLMPWVVDAA